MNILFISDGSVTNPILHSQGLPLLQSLEKKSYFISFETQTIDDYKRYVEKNLKNNFSKVVFCPIFLKGVFPFGLENIVFGVIKVISLCLRKRISIVHARSLIPAFIGIISKFLFLGKISIVFDNRGALIEEEILKGNWNRLSYKVKFFSFIEKLIVKYSNQIIVVSNSFKKHILANYNFLGINHKISVIPNGTKILLNNKNLPSNFSDRITCVYSGSSASWQKIESVFEFFVIAKKKFSNISFKIITYEIETFKEKAKKYLSLEPNILIANVPTHKVKDELSKCNFGILIRDNNIINNVASPLKFAEYLAAGLPVIVSENVGDTEEIINKYNVGVILRNNNYEEAIAEIMELLKDKQIKEKCKMVAKKEFDIKKSIEAYRNIYKKLIIK